MTNDKSFVFQSYNATFKMQFIKSDKTTRLAMIKLLHILKPKVCNISSLLSLTYNKEKMYIFYDILSQKLKKRLTLRYGEHADNIILCAFKQ